MKISEASERTGLSKDTLRYYERIGLLPDVPRKNGRIRDYQEKDIARIDFVKCMLGKSRLEVSELGLGCMRMIYGNTSSAPGRR